MSRVASPDLSGLPFPPGHSPFHVRGLNFLGMREYCIREVPGGVAGVLARLPSDSLRRFFEQPFLAVSMYDALPSRPISQAIAEQEGRPYDESVYRRALGVAQRDMGSVYRMLMSFVSPELALKALARVWARYFNFGQLEINAITPRCWEVTEVGLPTSLAPWFAPMSRAHITNALTMTGAQSVSPQVRGFWPSGRRDGVELVTLRLEVTWRDTNGA